MGGIAVKLSRLRVRENLTFRPHIFLQQEKNSQNLPFYPQGSGSECYCLISARTLYACHKRVNALLIVAGVTLVYFSFRRCYNPAQIMTEYNTRVIHTPSPYTAEKKWERRRILEAVYERRKLNYRRYITKLQERVKQGKITPSFD